MNVERNVILGGVKKMDEREYRAKLLRQAAEIQKIRSDLEHQVFYDERKKYTELIDLLNNKEEEYNELRLKYERERTISKPEEVDEEEQRAEEETPVIDVDSGLKEKNKFIEIRNIDKESIEKFKADLNTVIERRAKVYEHTSSGFKIMKGEFKPQVPGNLGKLRSSLNQKEKQVSDFIHEFSKTYDVSSNPELAKLIGVRDNASKKEDRGTTYVRPNYKQHLEPILKLEEDIKHLEEKKDDKNKAEIDKKKQELEEKKKRLGKKWELKLKMDHLLEEIRALKAELRELRSRLTRNDISPEERERILQEIGEKEGILSSKLSEFKSLSSQYQNVLKQIGELMGEALEKENEKKHKDFSETDERRKNVSDAEYNNGSPVRSSFIPSNNGASFSTSQGGLYSSYQPSTRREERPITETRVSEPLPSSREENTTRDEELPVTKKPLWERIKNRFKTPNGRDERILLENDLWDDTISQRLTYPLSKINYFEDTFDHTVIKDGKMLYVRTPLEMIDTSSEAIKEKVEQIKGKIIEPGMSDKQIAKRVKELLPPDATEKEIKKAIKLLNRSPESLLRFKLKEGRTCLMCALMDIEESGNPAEYLELVSRASRLEKRLNTKSSLSFTKNILVDSEVKNEVWRERKEEEEHEEPILEEKMTKESAPKLEPPVPVTEPKSEQDAVQEPKDENSTINKATEKKENEREKNGSRPVEWPIEKTAEAEDEILDPLEYDISIPGESNSTSNASNVPQMLSNEDVKRKRSIIQDLVNNGTIPIINFKKASRMDIELDNGKKVNISLSSFPRKLEYMVSKIQGPGYPPLSDEEMEVFKRIELPTYIQKANIQDIKIDGIVISPIDQVLTRFGTMKISKQKDKDQNKDRMCQKIEH